MRRRTLIGKQHHSFITRAEGMMRVTWDGRRCGQICDTTLKVNQNIPQRLRRIALNVFRQAQRAWFTRRPGRFPWRMVRGRGWERAYA